MRRLRSKREIRKRESLVLTDVIGLNWLDERPSKARSRVIRLIELLKVADKLVAELRKYGDEAYARPSMGHPQYLVTIRQYERVLDNINDILARYVGKRFFFVNNGYLLKPHFVETRFNSMFDGRGEIDWTGQDESYLTECKLVNYSLELTERGSINRLRTCRECRKWFYAMTGHQKNCSQACRQRFASHDRFFKERRRDYMQKYRREERERDTRLQQISRRKH